MSDQATPRHGAAGPDALRAHFSSHPRLWRAFQYVYPVISRRSEGLSIGINLNVDKVCNFDCVYCCVDRSVPPVRRDVDLARIEEELDWMLRWAVEGGIWDDAQFAAVPEPYRVVRDIAFSGDGEPTSYPRFADACRVAAEARTRFGLTETKLVVHTDASLLERPAVREGLAVLDANHGELWAKLDAGTEPYYRAVNRTRIPFQRVLDNIAATGRDRDLVIQSLFLALDGEPLPDDEFEAYLDRLDELGHAGCRIRLVQLYTVARRTAVSEVGPLTDAHLDRLAARLRARLPKLRCAVYYGVG